MLNDRLKVIPHLTNELNNNLGAEIDYSELKKEKEIFSAEIERLTNLIMDEDEIVTATFTVQPQSTIVSDDFNSCLHSLYRIIL